MADNKNKDVERHAAERPVRMSASDKAVATSSGCSKRDTNAARNNRRALAHVAATMPVSGGATPQRKRRSDSTMTKGARRRFLDGLALTCNVRMSAEHAGCSLAGAYYVRQRDPVFAEQWRAALAVGYDQLEALVLEHGGAGMPIAGDPARAEEEGLAAPAFDFDKAMKLLAFHAARRNGDRRGQGGPSVRNATREETNAALLKALAAAARRQAAREAAEQAE